MQQHPQKIIPTNSNKVKVTYYYRPKLPFGYSIEAVFEILKRSLNNRISFKDYFCSERWHRIYSLLTAWKFQNDVNHITGDAHFLALVLKGRKTILTVHDVGHYERTLKGFKKFLFGLFWIRIPVNRVEAITTTTDFTKKKILDLVPISPDKIHVIPNPAAPDFEPAPKIFNEENPTILQIGSGLNKNIHRLIDAITGLKCNLLLVRKKDAKLAALLEERNISYTWYQNLSREEVYNCYKACDIVYFASEYEGFGVPILEANAVGRCVITSTTTSMPEVAGGSAVLVDPYSVLSIRQAVMYITESKFLREKLIKTGFENLKRYKPEVVAEQYYQLYQTIAQKKN